MKSTILLLATAFVITFFTGCADNGKEYKMDKEHNIYYKGGGLDESTAKKLADYLKVQEYFQAGKNATVQIIKSDKTKDTVNLNFIVDKSKITPEMENTFILFGGMIAQKIFSAAPLTVHLCGKDFDELKNLGYAKPVAEVPPMQLETPADDHK